LKHSTIHRFLLVLCLGGSALSQIAVLAADVDQTVADGGIAVVHTGKGPINIGITLDEYEARLKTREKEVTERLAEAHTQQRKVYETELKAIQQRL